MFSSWPVCELAVHLHVTPRKKAVPLKCFQFGVSGNVGGWMARCLWIQQSLIFLTFLSLLQRIVCCTLLMSWESLLGLI